MKIMAVGKQKEELARIRQGLNLIGRRIVPYVCHSYDSDKFFQWQMNCCRQIAMVVNGFLTSKEMAHYKIKKSQIFESNYEDPIFGKYDHAWNTCVIGTFQYQSMLIDMGTIVYKPLAILNVKSSIHDLRSAEAGYNITHLDTAELFPSQLNKGREYYTDLPGKEFVELCLSYLWKYI
jgi:hypothetical protein